MTYDVFMKRTTMFLTDDLERKLQEVALRLKRPQAEVVREALAEYLYAHDKPWPSSVGLGANSDPSVTSDNIKEWVRDRWRRDELERDEAKPAPPSC